MYFKQIVDCNVYLFQVVIILLNNFEEFSVLNELKHINIHKIKSIYD